MQFGFLLEQVVNGLVLGGYYLLIALGLSLIFSVGGVVNLAHGAFYAIGAYVALEVNRRYGFAASIVISPAVVGYVLKAAGPEAVGLGYTHAFLVSAAVLAITGLLGFLFLHPDASRQRLQGLARGEDGSLVLNARAA